MSKIDRYSGEGILLCKSSDELVIGSRWVTGFEAAKVAAFCNPAIVLSKRVKMGAAIFAGNRLLAAGFNQWNKTNPDNKVTGVKKEFAYTVHAEQSAALKIKYRADNSKNRLICYVVRISAAGTFACSKPCNRCIAKLKSVGVSVVRYHNIFGEPEEILI